jgi:hypothetical protein
VAVSRNNSSRSRADNMTGRFNCEAITTVLVRQERDLPDNSLPATDTTTKQRHTSVPAAEPYATSARVRGNAE